ncbi:hypothetical protein CR513_23648, partial [Mucuna pruriens]
MVEVKVISLDPNDLSKFSDTCSLTMKGKSSFNISSSISQSIWIIGSGATNHMTPFFSHLTSYSRVSGKQLIIIANGDHVPIVGIHQHPTPILSILTQLTFIIFIVSFRTLPLRRMILIAKEQGRNKKKRRYLLITKQPQKLGQLPKFDFTTSIWTSTI